MDGYIKASTLKKVLSPYLDGKTHKNSEAVYSQEYIYAAIDVLLSTEHGAWIRTKDEAGNEVCHCSECGETACAGNCFWDLETPYCPWCGAKMEDA